MQAMKKYKWPGNIRELENMVKQFQAMVPGDTIFINDLPQHIATPGTQPPPTLAAHKTVPAASANASGIQTDLSALTWKEMEHSYILSLLDKFRWNISQAARAAEINRSTFDSRMKKLGISKKAL